jgi:photosystem II stability/assembly factor-like uncharacterized protein
MRALAALAAAAPISVCHAGVNSWTTIGPYGGPGSGAFAMAPSAPNVLYFGGLTGRIYRSSDSGQTWVWRGARASVTSLVVDPTNADIVYGYGFAGTQTGVLKSVNGGATWVSSNSGVPSSTFTGAFAPLVIDPRNPRTLYTDHACQGLFKSTDGAGSWSEINSAQFPRPGMFGCIEAHDLAVDAINGNMVLASFRGTQPALFVSYDGGTSWTPIDVPVAEVFGAYGVAIHPSAPNVIFVEVASDLEGSPLLKSIDGGSTWTVSDAGMPPGPLQTVEEITFDSTDPSTMYALSVQKLYKSTDSGSSWSHVSTNGNYPGTLAFAINPKNGSELFLSTFDGVFRSTDAGATWTFASDGLPGLGVRSLAIDAAQPAKIYAGTDLSVTKSVDAGATWAPQSADLSGPVFEIQLGPPGSGLLFAAHGSGVSKSLDSGATWSYSSQGLPPNGLGGYEGVTALMLDPAVPSVLFSGRAFGDEPIYKSTDGGSTWLPSSAGIPPHTFIHDFETAPGLVFAATSDGVYVSVDAGTSWQPRNNGLASGNLRRASAFAIDRAAGVLHVATAGGMYRSSNYGDSWVPTNLAVDTLSALIDLRDSRIVYAGTDGNQIYRSIDGGLSYAKFAAGLAASDWGSLRIYDLRESGTTLYAATSVGVFSFEHRVATLSVTKNGSGTGTVMSSPTGIGCGTECVAEYDAGTMITLTAAPAAGSAFGGWGGACTGVGTCQVQLQANVSVVATFDVLAPTGGGAAVAATAPSGDGGGGATLWELAGLLAMLLGRVPLRHPRMLRQASGAARLRLPLH